MLKFASILFVGMVLVFSTAAPSLATSAAAPRFKPDPNCEYTKISKGQKIAAAQYCSGKETPAELTVVRRDGTSVVFTGVPYEEFTGLTEAISPDIFYSNSLEGNYQSRSDAQSANDEMWDPNCEHVTFPRNGIIKNAEFCRSNKEGNRMIVTMADGARMKVEGVPFSDFDRLRNAPDPVNVWVSDFADDFTMSPE